MTELSTTHGRNVDPKLAAKSESVADQFLEHIRAGLLPLEFPKEVQAHPHLAPVRAKEVTQGEVGCMKYKQIAWVAVPRVARVASAVRMELVGQAENDLDGALWSHFQQNVIMGNQFDVYEYYAKLRFSLLDKKDWNDLSDDLRDGFINMSRHDITEAITASTGY